MLLQGQSEWDRRHDGDEGLPPHWFSDFAVDDIGASTKQAESLGGKVCVPVTPIPNVGYFPIVEGLALYKGSQ